MSLVPQYGKKVDEHIYIGPGKGCDTSREWIDLALAALDQAGVSIKTCRKIADILDANIRKQI